MAEIHLIGRAASPGLAIGPVTMLTASMARRTASDDPAQEAAALKRGNSKSDPGSNSKQDPDSNSGYVPALPKLGLLPDGASAAAGSSAR